MLTFGGEMLKVSFRIIPCWKEVLLFFGETTGHNSSGAHFYGLERLSGRGRNYYASNFRSHIEAVAAGYYLGFDQRFTNALQL